MSLSWQIGGYALNTLTVTTVVEPMTLKADQASRIQQSPRLHSLARRHILGRDLPVYAMRFRFIGPAQDRTIQMNYVRGLLKATDTWVLQAPDAPNETYFNAGLKTIQLSTVSISTVYGEGNSVIALDVVALEPSPEDQVPQPGDTGLVRGVAQVFVTLCGAIGEDALFAVAVLRNEPVPVTADIVFGVALLQSDSPSSGEAVSFGDTYLVAQEAPRSEGLVIHNP